MAGIVLFVIVSLRFFFNYTAPHGIYTVLHTLSLHDALPISRLNSTLRRLGSGWALFVEAQRVPALSYPVSDFPDVVSELVEVERREQFREEGAHFESFYYLTLLWMPPAEEAARAEAWLYEGRSKTGVDPKELLKSFIDRTGRMLHLIEGFMPEAERSEEHTSELQSLMRLSYAVFFWKK